MLPLETQAFIRVAYGILLFVFFSLILPFGRVYFTSEKFGGCIQSSKWHDRLFSPINYYVMVFAWLGLSLMFIFNVYTVFAGLANLILARFFFVKLRWTTPLRGMGAPGYITYWIAALVLMMEYSKYYGDVQGQLNELVVFAFRFDFGLMMIDSAFNKIKHGYARSTGMNYGMANPCWGYWPSFFKKFPATHWIFQFFNHSAYLFQILGGILMIIPDTRWIGGVIIFGSFLLVKTIVRLGVLCDKLMLITFIYGSQGGWMDSFLQQLNLFQAQPAFGSAGPIPWLNSILTVILWTYVCFLPFAKLGMYTNLYLKKKLPKLIQSAVNGFTNFFGVILWRVFTIELIDYFILVHFEDKDTKKRTQYTRFGWWSLKETNRFLWVGESIMSVIIFNSARYFPGTNLFEERLLRYSRTLPYPPNSHIIYEYVVIDDGPTQFEYVPAKEVRVDPVANKILDTKVINEVVLDKQTRLRSPVHATAGPGNYVPADND